MKFRHIGSNQAVQEFRSGLRVFWSYEGPVAALVPGRGYIRVADSRSKTSERHIRDWIGDAPYEVVPLVDMAMLLAEHDRGDHTAGPDVEED